MHAQIRELRERILGEVPGAIVHVEEPSNPATGHWFLDVEARGAGDEARRAVIEWIPGGSFGVWSSLPAPGSNAEAPTFVPEVFGDTGELVKRVAQLLLGPEP